jgi:Calponin homology (CH) domain
LFVGKKKMAFTKKQLMRTTSMHIVTDNEKRALVEYINWKMKDEKQVASIIPIDAKTNALFESCKSGVLLCTFFNVAMPKELVIPKHKIHTSNLTKFTIMENNNLLLEYCRKAGCTLVNFGQGDISSGQPHLILSVVWRIVELSLSFRYPSALRRLNLDLQKCMLQKKKKSEQEEKEEEEEQKKARIKTFVLSQKK